MKDKKPDQRLIWMAPTIFVAIITLIAAFGREGDKWFDSIFKFQTLITGGLAILAAYITIGEMRRSDERADKRHADVMNKITRAELVNKNILRNTVRLIEMRESQIIAIESDTENSVASDIYAEVWVMLGNTIADADLINVANDLTDANDKVIIRAFCNQFVNTTYTNASMSSFKVNGLFVERLDAKKLASSALLLKKLSFLKTSE